MVSDGLLPPRVSECQGVLKQPSCSCDDTWEARRRELWSMPHYMEIACSKKKKKKNPGKEPDLSAALHLPQREVQAASFHPSNPFSTQCCFLPFPPCPAVVSLSQVVLPDSLEESPRPGSWRCTPSLWPPRSAS